MDFDILQEGAPDLDEARARIAEARASLERASEIGDSPELRAVIDRLDRIEAELERVAGQVGVPG